MYKKLILIAIVFFTVISCEKAYDPGTTKSAKVSNEWWVNLYLNGAAQYSSFGKISTYNTAADNDSIWIDDFKNIWDFKCKAKFNADSLTFRTTNAQNLKYNIKVTIKDAKIMLNAAKSKTGNVTDSIYFKVIFSDDPTSTYEIKGSARTMWSEDDY